MEVLQKETSYNRYSATFTEFKAACEEFFANPVRYHRQLRALLMENCQIFGYEKQKKH